MSIISESALQGVPDEKGGLKAEGAGREAVTDQSANDREESGAGAVEVVSRPALQPEFLQENTGSFAETAHDVSK